MILYIQCLLGAIFLRAPLPIGPVAVGQVPAARGRVVLIVGGQDGRDVGLIGDTEPLATVASLDALAGEAVLVELPLHVFVQRDDLGMLPG